MIYKIQYDSQRDLVILKTEKELEVKKFPSMLQEMAEALTIHPTANLLADHTGSTASSMETYDIIEMSTWVQQLTEALVGKKFAVVLQGDLEYGLGRMWMVFTQEEVPFEISIFHSSEEARQWLQTAH